MRAKKQIRNLSEKQFYSRVTGYAEGQVGVRLWMQLWDKLGKRIWDQGQLYRQLRDHIVGQLDVELEEQLDELSLD